MIFRETPCLSLRRYSFEMINRHEWLLDLSLLGKFIQTNKGEMV